MAKRTTKKQAEPKTKRTPGDDRAPEEHTGTPPEMSNRDHPGAPHARVSAPGEGIISGDTHVRAGYGNADKPDRVHPNRTNTHAPERSPAPTGASPGAMRPDTTRSGVHATPGHSGGHESSSAGATETQSFGESAPLSVPSNLTGPAGSAGPAADETADPNFTAATRRPRSDTGDAGVSRMTTGANAPRDARVPDERDRRPGPASSRAARVVRDVMTADLEVANPATELYYVARMMAERDIGAVPVVESTDTMRPIGIITDRDIVVRVIAKNEDPKGVRVGQVMTPDVLSVRETAMLEEALRLMEERQVRRMLVVDDAGRCRGIISQGDIALGASEWTAGELLREVSEPPD